ncbi:MAG: cyclophilin-like fold protein [Chitinophagales bacterium]
MRIRITAGDVSGVAELNETKTAGAIRAALPIEARANTWGDEIYFSIPVKLGGENGRAEVAVGDLGYWPPGNAFCIFFGPTPASVDREPRAASPVNVFGKLVTDPLVFKKVRSGATVRITAEEEA